MIEPYTLNLPKQTAVNYFYDTNREGQNMRFRTQLFDLRFQVHGGKLSIGGWYRIEAFVRVKNRFRDGDHWKKVWGVGENQSSSYIPDFDWSDRSNGLIACVKNDGLKQGIVFHEHFVREAFEVMMSHISIYRSHYGPKILGGLALAQTA